MGTIDFLKGLDLQQLRFARDKAEEMIAAIEDQEKVLLWAVEDRLVRESFSIDYETAARKLLELALERKETGDLGEMSLYLTPVKVPASEVERYISP